MKPRNWVILLLAIGLCFTSAFKSERSEALLPGLAAYATLEVILIGSGVAAAVGIITIQQHKGFQRQVASLTERLREATNDLLEDISREVRDLYKNYVRSTKKSITRAKPTTPAKDADCKAGANDDPRKCCSNWFKNHSDTDRKIGYFIAHAGQKAFQVFGLGSTGQTLRCCIEWDSVHARFEVFTPGGDGKYTDGKSGDSYTHKGEFSCQNGDGDPCQASHPGKADNSGGHSPRGGCRDNLRVKLNVERGASGAGSSGTVK